MKRSAIACALSLSALLVAGKSHAEPSQRDVGWLTLGVGAGAVAGGVILFSTASARIEDERQVLRNGGTADSDHLRGANMQGDWGLGLMIGGLIGAGVGTTLILLATPDEPEGARMALTLGPGSAYLGGLF